MTSSTYITQVKPSWLTFQLLLYLFRASFCFCKLFSASLLTKRFLSNLSSFFISKLSHLLFTFQISRYSLLPVPFSSPCFFCLAVSSLTKQSPHHSHTNHPPCCLRQDAPSNVS
ncbi:unnamed protein product, partial [Pylaiella littoralis]